MALLHGRTKGSYTDIHDKVAQYMREERMGHHLVDDDLTDDEMALFLYSEGIVEGPGGLEAAVQSMERISGEKFDPASLLKRLEQFYADGLAGKVVVNYDDGLAGLWQDMDKLRQKVGL